MGAPRWPGIGAKSSVRPWLSKTARSFVMPPPR